MKIIKILKMYRISYKKLTKNIMKDKMKVLKSYKK